MTDEEYKQRKDNLTRVSFKQCTEKTIYLDIIFKNILFLIIP